MLRTLRYALLLLLCTACATPTHVSIPRRAQRIEGQVWSPYCPGKLLIDCTTVQAGELRARITRELRAGRSDAAVLRGIREDFGPSALARPPSGNAGTLLWSVPLVVFALGAVLVVWLVRRRRPKSDPTTPASLPTSSLESLRDEVRRNI